MWTREAFVDWTGMPSFCAEHLVWLVLIAMLAVGLPWTVQAWSAKGRLSAEGQQRIAAGLAGVAAFGYFSWLLLATWYGAFDIRRDLPLEFCTIAGLMAPAAMLGRRQWTFDFFYYAAFTGVLGACITPIFAPAWPHPRAVSFWAIHGGVVIGAVYAVTTLKKRPTYRGIYTTTLLLAAMLGVIVPVNHWFDANYMYLRDRPTGSLLELVDKAPAVLLGFAMLGITLFHVIYLPFARRPVESPAIDPPSIDSQNA